jgi:tripartite-type tricarboxylate transporter receptor subunit TctC
MRSKTEGISGHPTRPRPAMLAVAFAAQRWRAQLNGGAQRWDRLAQRRSGQVRALAITAAARSPLAPKVPTLQESFPGAEGALETIIAVLGPAGMPVATVARLDEAIRTALTRPALQERFAALSTTVLPLTTSALAARIRADNGDGRR